MNVSSTGPKAAGATPLHLAATGGHIDVMDELLERGANIEVRTKGGCGCEYLDRVPAVIATLPLVVVLHLEWLYYGVQALLEG